MLNLAQDLTFIEFFAPVTVLFLVVHSHSIGVATAWAQLRRRMQRKLNIAEVDCERVTTHGAVHGPGVNGFPIMSFYAHGVKTEYTGARSYVAFVATYPLRLLHSWGLFQEHAGAPWSVSPPRIVT